MKRFLFAVVCVFCLVSCKKELPKKELPEKSIPKQATNTKIATFNYEKLKPLLHLKDDKIYVVNFWATWCAPCVKELPYFERLGKLYKEKNVEVLLVSLDFPKKIESKLIPFLEKKGIKSKVVLLDDTNEQFWIRDISEDWSGALPGTLIYNKDKRAFYEKSFTYESLEQTVQTFLN